MKTTLALGAALLALAACSGDGDSGNEANGNAAHSSGAAAEANGVGAAAPGVGADAAGNSVAAAPSAAPGGAGELQPGEWETVAQVLSASPNAPASARTGQPQTRRSCMSAEESRQLAQGFFGSLDGQQCSRREFIMRNGRIEGHLACAAGGGSSTAAINGEYSRTTFAFNVNVSASAPGGAPPMAVRTRVTARRLGDCRPGSESAQQSAPARGTAR